MSKKFKILVDGVEHLVEVEEIEGSVSNVAPSPIVKPQQASTKTSTTTQHVVSGEKITAPLQGNILSVKVKQGDTVKSGDILVVIEAMKMENEIVAPHDGSITAVFCSEHQKVSSGDVLLTM